MKPIPYSEFRKLFTAQWQRFRDESWCLGYYEEYIKDPVKAKTYPNIKRFSQELIRQEKILMIKEAIDL